MSLPRMPAHSRHRLGTWCGLALGVAASACSSADESATIDSPSVAPTNEGASPGEVAAIRPSRESDVDAPPSSGLGASESAGSALLPEDPGGDAITAPTPPTGGGNEAVEPGTLTAGAWDDNRNLERFLEYRAELLSEQMPGLVEFDEAVHRAAAAAAAEVSSHVTLDVALVIDTTGSMGDELTYLQSEFDALSSAIELEYPDADQRWALVVYKDVGDVYTTRAFDFQGAGQGFRDSLAAQSAGGGGDIPEASDAALEAMNQLSWRSDDATARVAFWVGDAPHHNERAQAFKAAVEVAQGQGIHLYPVASSGVDELTELSMRSAAQLTLGRYLFLTDDSGVGGEHKEPTIPCYFVTRLNDAILRMVDIEMVGVYREPEPSQIIRSGGNPSDGACRLASGQTVFVF